MTGHPSQLSRRDLLALGLGLSSVAIGAAGCQVQLTDDRPGAKEASGKIKIPDPLVDLPTEDVTFRYVEAGGPSLPYTTALFKAYQEKHPNITIDHQHNGWPAVNEKVTLGIRNGSAPDIWHNPAKIPFGTAVTEGWIQPVEDLVPNFADIKKEYPAESFVPGTHVFNDKVYLMPLASNRSVSQYITYDLELFEQADIDSERDLASWDDLRSAAKKLTDAGKGKSFGVMVPGAQRMGRALQQVAATAGWLSSEHLGGMCPKNGEYINNAPEMIEALEFLQSLQSDGSFFPGTMGLDGEAVGGRMPSQVAAMLLEGPWFFDQWAADAPDWKFDLIRQPAPEGATDYTEPYYATGAQGLVIYAESMYPEIAADILSYMGSREGQTQMVRLTNGNLRSVIEEVNATAQENFELSPPVVKAGTFADEQMRAAPLVAIRNPADVQVTLEHKQVKPNVNEIVQGIFTGQVKDGKKALQEFNDKQNRALDDAIAAARKKGADISRADYVFSNWDPAKDYTQGDYEDL